MALQIHSLNTQASGKQHGQNAAIDAVGSGVVERVKGESCVFGWKDWEVCGNIYLAKGH